MGGHALVGKNLHDGNGDDKAAALWSRLEDWGKPQQQVRFEQGVAMGVVRGDDKPLQRD